jgi:hypothetical protein
MEWTARNGAGINVMMTREVGLPVCHAIRAFGRGLYSQTIDLLEPVRWLNL